MAVRAASHEGIVADVDAHSALLLTVPEVASLLRTSVKAIYLMIDREQLPGVRRIGRRVLVKRVELLHFLDHNCAPSRRSPR